MTQTLLLILQAMLILSGVNGGQELEIMIYTTKSLIIMELTLQERSELQTMQVGLGIP